MGLLAIGSLCVGLLVNGMRAQPLPLGYTPPQGRLEQMVARMSSDSSARQSPTIGVRPWQKITLDEFQAIVTAHQGLSIDARPQAFYQAGHVPGALNLPRGDFEKGYVAIRPLLEPAREKPIVVYCSEANCKDGELVSDALSRLGYRYLYVYTEGWEEWSRAGLLQEASRTP